MDITQLKMIIAQKLRTTREEQSLSQEDVAKQLGVTTGAYGSFERAKNLIALNYLIDLSRIFQKPITDFLPGHVITNNEHNSPMLDPLFREIADSWSDLDLEEKDALLIFTRLFQKVRREQSGE